jgi:23S rRNA (guanine2445-N2)-methyltransferase / 23S rRNA (guanine2069-N7)-methyltransferase
MGNVAELHHLYESLGNIASESLPAWRTTLITDNADLGKFTGLTLFDKVPFDNGPIACQVMHYRAARALSAQSQKQEPEREVATTENDSNYVLSDQGEMFANRFKKNLKHLAKWAKKNGFDCYRVYDADLPDYAVAVDIYGEYIHVQEYAPPKDIDPDKALQRLNDVMYLIPNILNIPSSQVVLKLRQKQRGTQQYEAQASLKQRLKVNESGLNFWVNLTDYLDTGLFLDHRITRQKIASLAAGENFLNLFAYTGSATVYAAMGGAVSTTTVDMSNTYLSWAQDNLSLNGFKGEQHQFIRANCLEWLQSAQEEKQRYGLIFLDPPTFSNSSRMEGVFEIQRDHVTLINSSVKLLKKGGQLVFSTNRRDFKMDKGLLKSLVMFDISHETLPTDFKRNTKIHACWIIKSSG